MKTDLTTEQISSYGIRGFVHVPALLSPLELEELKAAVLDAVSKLKGKKIADGGIPRLDRNGYYDKVFTQRINISQFNAVIEKYVRSSDLGDMACRLAGVSVLRIYIDQALIKEPFGNPTAWHLDCPYWSFYSRDAISVWIALEDATALNGCMCFLPGSHELAGYDNLVIGQDLGGLFNLYPRMRTIDPVALSMKAGDCSFHNGLVAHGAGANMTHGRRVAMTAAYMPAGSTFNGQQDSLPNAYFGTLKIGDELCDDAFNPIVGRL